MFDISPSRSVLVAGASVFAFAVVADPALAQAAAPTAAAPAASSDQGAGNDVIVTAEHHQAKLQKVPVAVSAFTGAQRDRVGINTVQEVSNFAPGFVYDPADVHAYIRGVGRQALSDADDSRVTAYEDGFFVYAPFQLGQSSLFLSQEQIERGPQNIGGRNAAAGSIDMISVRPTDAPYAEVRATAANYNHYEVEGAVSGQAAPGLDLRLSGYENSQSDGYYKNLAGGPSEGGVINEWYIEAQADLKLGANADLWARAFTSGWDNRGDVGARNGYTNGSWDETNLTDPNAYLVGSLFVNPNYGYAAILPGAANGHNPADPLPVSATLANPNIFNNPSATNPYNFAAINPRINSLRNYNDINYILTYHFPDMDFRYIGGYQGYDYRVTYSDPDTDVTSFTLPGSTETPAPLLTLYGLPPQSYLVVNPLVTERYADNDWWTSHEVSLQSTSNSPFQWTAGLYYYYQHYTNPIQFTAPGQANVGAPLQILPFVNAGENPLVPGALTPAALNPQRLLTLLSYDFNTQSEAGYFQAAYKVSDEIRLVGDMRYTEDQKWGTEYNRTVAFNSTFIDALSPYFGAYTPSFDETLLATCPTGTGAPGLPSCFAGPLAKGVKSIGVVGANGVESRALSGSSGALTGGAAIEWTPTNDIFVYGRYSRGYEDITFNAGYISNDPEVAPEFVNAYEVGYKQNFGRKLSIDIAAFYYDYDNLQLPITVLTPITTQTEFINVPKSQSTGIEFEGYWSPIPDLLVTATYALDYTAILTKCSGVVTGGILTPAPGALCDIDTNDPAAVAPGARPFPHQVYDPLMNPGLYQSVNGAPLPDAPRNKIALNVAYTWRFAPGDLTFSSSYIWRDVQDASVFDRVYNNAPSWSDVDLRLLWVGDHDRYEIIGYVKNLFNTLQYEAGGALGAGGQGLVGNATTTFTPATGLYQTANFTLAPPRLFGIEVRYKFF